MKKALIQLILICHGYIGLSQTYTGTGGAIPDDGTTIDFSLNVTGLSPTTIDTIHGLLSVCVNITHTYDSDLDVLLISPDGTSFKLFSGVGGSGSNFSNTCLTHTATNTIASGSAPFTGSYTPMERMGNVNNGQNGNGNWTLRILDTYAFADAGNLLSWTITFGSNAQGPYIFESSNIPLVLIDTYGNTIADEPKIKADFKLIDNGSGSLNHLTDSPAFDGEMGIEIRGAYSSSLPQKPYTFTLNDGDTTDVDTSLLLMPREHDWHLLANYNDKAFVRNTLANHLFREMGNYAIRSKFCEVFLNNQYQGIYLLSETIKRDKNRVDIAKLTPDEIIAPDVSGGYILKNDYWDGSNSWLNSYSPIDHPTFDIHTVYHYPKPEDISAPQKTYIQDFVYNFETALYSSSFEDSLTGYKAYADVFSFVDYLIVNELARNNDGFKKSFYFHKDKDKTTGLSKLYCGPVWDFDWAWKNIWSGGCIFDATDGSGWAHHINDCGPDVNSNGWHVRMMQDVNFQNILRCRWERFRETILDTTYLFHYIDSCASYLNEAQQRHYEKWGHLGLNSGAPEVGPIPTSYAGEVEALKDWIALRINWLDANIPGTASNCTFVGVPSYPTSLNFTYYPNPATTTVQIETGYHNGQLQLKAIDIKGNILLNIPLASENLQTLEVGHWPNGIYTLIVSGEKTVQHHKLIVTH